MSQAIRKGRVLITDDDTAVQDAFRMIFEHAGYDTDIHTDGQRLLSGDYQLPDLFILDKQLPGVDGLDICRHLKATERSRSVPVLMLSASPKLEVQALAAGADSFQEKPFRMHDLLEKVRVLLARSEPAE